MEDVVDIMGSVGGVAGDMDGLASGVGNVRNVSDLGFRMLLSLLDVGGMAVDSLGNVAVHLVALLLQLVVQPVALSLKHCLLHLVRRLHGLLLRVEVRHHQGADVLLLVAVAVLVEVVEVEVVVVSMALLVHVVEIQVMLMLVLVAFAVPSQQHALVLVVVLGSAVAVYLVDGHHLFGRGGRGGRDTEGGRTGLDKLELTWRLRVAAVL